LLPRTGTYNDGVSKYVCTKASSSAWYRSIFSPSRRPPTYSLFTYVPAKLGEHKGYVSRQLGKHRNPNP
jgi:hypothetical protein